ncbi:MAG: hypothetical protein AB7V18_06900 [Pyrinomonadaceae bacterium]
MDRSSNGNGTFAKHFQTQRSWLYDVEPYARTGPRTLDEVADDERLKQAMRRTVAKTIAPSYLIDTIRNEIRKG